MFQIQNIIIKICLLYLCRCVVMQAGKRSSQSLLFCLQGNIAIACAASVLVIMFIKNGKGVGFTCFSFGKCSIKIAFKIGFVYYFATGKFPYLCLQGNGYNKVKWFSVSGSSLALVFSRICACSKKDWYSF